MTDRQHARVALALEVEFRTAGAFLVAYTTNLSKGGMFVETDDPLAVGTELALRFAVPGQPPIDVVGVVAWVQAWKTDERPKGMGIRFERLDAVHGDAIDRIVSVFSGLRILLMSPDRAARAQLERMIGTVVGTAEIVEASDGEQAEAALARPIDLVVVDLAVTLDDALDGDPTASNPGSASDGLLTVRLAKSARPPLPVLALAGDADKRVLASELGADVVLGNPPHFAELQGAILRLLGQPSQTALR